MQQIEILFTKMQIEINVAISSKYNILFNKRFLVNQ